MAVNGRPVVGTSGYWRELRRYEEGTATGETFVPFVVSPSGALGRVEEERNFSHCTCGKET